MTPYKLVYTLNFILQQNLLLNDVILFPAGEDLEDSDTCRYHENEDEYQVIGPVQVCVPVHYQGNPGKNIYKIIFK